MPKHVRATDVVGESPDRLISIKDAKEFYIFMEEAGGTPYFEDLEAILKRGRLDPQDVERDIVYRSLAVMAQLLVEEGQKNVIIDATGNQKAFRDLARDLISEFAEIYVKCPLETCEARETSREGQLVQRDLYKQASKGNLSGAMPGVTVPYEVPPTPEVVVESDQLSPQESAERIMAYIQQAGWMGEESLL